MPMRAIVMSLVVAVSLVMLALPYDAAADCGDRIVLSSTAEGDAMAASGVAYVGSLGEGAQQTLTVRVNAAVPDGTQLSVFTNGLQPGQWLDTTNPADPCVLGIVPGSPAPNVLPNPAAPLAFTANFPGEFFYWRTTAVITGVGGNLANKALLVMSTQGGFNGPTLTPADGPAAVGVFARYRVRFLPGGLVPGATYTFTGPFGTQSFVASATGTINFTVDQGCIPTPGAVPPPCNFAAARATTND